MKGRSFWIRLCQGSLIALVISGALFGNEFLRVRNVLEREASGRLELLANVLHREFEDLAKILLVFSLSAQVRDFLEDPNPSTQLDVEQEAILVMDLNLEFDQIRLIGGDYRELMRVTRREGALPGDRLTDVSSLPYVSSAFTLPPGLVYFSNFSLTRQDGEIVLPELPTVRVATVLDSAEPAVASINVSLRDFLTTIENYFPKGAAVFQLLNAEGQWEVAGDPSIEWARDYPERDRFSLSKTNPELWEAISSSNSGARYSGTTLYSWNWIQPARSDLVTAIQEDRFHVLLSEISLQAVLERSAKRLPLLVVVFVLLTAAFTAWLCILDARRRQAQRSREQLEELNQELSRSNEELQQFAYVASHDLQEPLRMVSSYTQLLERRYRDHLDDKARKYIHYAVDGAVRMQQLINDLLEYSRLATREAHVVPVRMDHALDAALANLEAPIRENAALVTREPLPEVFGDVSRLTMLFQNLISNALKYRGETRPEVEIGCDILGQGAEPFYRISIRDNGIGIAPRYHDKIFVLFQRLHSRAEYSGTGIGLAVCKRIVEAFGGEIWFESKEGEGSTFYFKNPLPELSENRSSR